MEQIHQQSEDTFLPLGKNKLTMAEFLLQQNTLCLQMMLTTQLSQPQNLLLNQMSFLEGTIRCNHILSYNLIMSYMTENVAQKKTGETVEIAETNERNQQEEQKNQQEEEKDRDDMDDEQFSDLSEEELFDYELFEDIGFSKKEINKIPIIEAKALLKQFSTNILVKSKKINKRKDSQSELSSTQEKCCICLQNYRSNAKLRQLQCKHQFHVKCIDRWLKKSKKCPFCRKIVKIDEF